MTKNFSNVPAFETWFSRQSLRNSLWVFLSIYEFFHFRSFPIFGLKILRECGTLNFSCVQTFEMFILQTSCQKVASGVLKHFWNFFCWNIFWNLDFQLFVSLGRKISRSSRTMQWFICINHDENLFLKFWNFFECFPPEEFIELWTCDSLCVWDY